MANMGYCRFENTEGDLKDCARNMNLSKDASEDEKKARLRLIALCVEIALDYGDEVDQPVQEAE